MPSGSRPTRASAQRPHPVRIGLAALALLGALALVVASFTDVVQVQVHGAVVGADSGLDRYGPALVLLALAGCVLAALALRGSTPAAAGLLVVGLIVVLLAILGDVPDLDRHGAYPEIGPAAVTAAGAGFYLETLGGVLFLLAGGGLWVTAAPAGRESS